jgi:hypothetical protein
VRSLGIDAVADTLDRHPVGCDIAQRLGGPSLRAWFTAYSSPSWEREEPDILDLCARRSPTAC